MTDHEINAAVAELCGWKWDFNDKKEVFWMNKSKPFQTFRYPPSYASDLNAMHEAEKVLVNEQVQTYEAALTEVFYRGARCCDFSLYPNDRIWHATARQRAEAFLRTLGKWREA